MFQRGQVKTGAFNFVQIEKYFAGHKNRHDSWTVSDRTLRDLDLEDVFAFIDRTVSCVGQQYLYRLFRTIPRDGRARHSLDDKIGILKRNPALRELATVEISRLSRNDAYYISSLFQNKHIAPPSWLWIIKLLAALSVLSASLSFIFPKALLVLLVLFPVNMILHYWNKNNVYQYSSSIPQMLNLNQVARKLLAHPDLLHFEEVIKSSKVLHSPAPIMSLFKIEAKLQSEIGQLVDYMVELIKAVFLIEPITLFTALNILESRRRAISIVFEFVGELDAALSILALRESVPYYCEIDTNVQSVAFTAAGMYHPLLPDGVPNDLALNRKSALLTGSNMSGKTTFIRTVGVNAILGQTINTCFARTFRMPAMMVESAIRISDDLFEGKSYYLEEVATIKSLVESNNGSGSLILLDELFKGTNSTERIAIAKSVLAYLAKRGNLVFVATHDRELADYLTDDYDIYHFTEVIERDAIHFDYKIKPGQLTTTNAIQILAINHFPEVIISEATELAEQLQRHAYVKDIKSK